MTTDPVVVRQFVNATDCSESMILVIDEFGRRCLNVVHGHCIDAAKDLGGGHAASVGQELSTNVFGSVGMSVKSCQHGGFQIQLGTLHFFIRRRMNQTDQVVHAGPNHIIHLVVRTHHVQSKEASILVARVECSVRVSEFVFRDFLSQSGCVISSEALCAVIRTQHTLHQE